DHINVAVKIGDAGGVATFRHGVRRGGPIVGSDIVNVDCVECGAASVHPTEDIYFVGDGVMGRACGFEVHREIGQRRPGISCRVIAFGQVDHGRAVAGPAKGVDVGAIGGDGRLCNVGGSGIGGNVRPRAYVGG